MLRFDEALHWVQVGFFVAIGLGSGLGVAWILLRIFWKFLHFVWNEVSDWELKKYVEQIENQGKSSN
jgi:hypothetical protein